MDVYTLLQLYRTYRPQLKDSSAEIYRYACRSLERHLGRTPRISDLMEPTLLGWVASRVGSSADWTVRREVGTLLRLWRFAWRRHLTSADPRESELPRISVRREPPLALTPQEMRAILAACQKERGQIRATDISKGMWFRSLLTAMYYSGSRVSALVAARKADLDYSTGWLLLRAADAKTGFGQYCQLPTDAMTLIHCLKHDGEAIWPMPYNRRWMWTVLKRIVRRAGLPADRKHGFHAIRRTVATLATVEAGIDFARIALGHSKESMTLGYVDPRFCTKSLSGILPRIVG